MLIGEIAKAAGVSSETVRFYARIGLLNPTRGSKGGRNPYKIFSLQDLESLRMTRLGQSFGMTLKECLVVRKAAHKGELTDAKRQDVIRQRLAALEVKAADLEALIARLRAALPEMISPDQ